MNVPYVPIFEVQLMDFGYESVEKVIRAVVEVRGREWMVMLSWRLLMIIYLE